MQIMAHAMAKGGMLGKCYVHVEVRARSSAYGEVSCARVCVCVWKGHKHTCTRGYTLTVYQQLFSIANPQSFGEVLVTPMGKIL